jgi:hypothetical protein
VNRELFSPGEHPFDPSSLPPDQQVSYYLQATQNAMALAIEQLRHENEQFRAEQQARNEEMAEGLRQVADASARRMKDSEEYYVRTVLGRVFAPEISAKRMTKLLQVVGIVGAHGVPLSQYRSGNEPLAKPKPFSEYPTWLFHAQKTMRRINTWLEEHEYYEDFHTTTTKNDRDAFIDMLYEEFCS